MHADGSEPAEETVDVVRETRRGDRRYRIRATYNDEQHVQLDVRIFDDSGATLGRLSGAVDVNDVAASGRAVASLLGAIAAALGQGTVVERLSVGEVRRRHPNAYEPWSPEDEERLTERYQAGASIKRLADEFGRQTGGILSRLKRLNLIATDKTENTSEDVTDFLPDEPARAEDYI
ncbi:hypothetical protein C1I95_27850 [Micromonospora craterilacus]|uniref:Helix-turn-helix domain containing protein n=2 Tax=Micromonospora craterilacus TaxID=1655439 RepID=A0A2W2DIL5_9ACTN|nr:hypothetical protein C1I95_27850 [Micromonospora craterilacus]